jgi:hypothetical protein
VALAQVRLGAVVEVAGEREGGLDLGEEEGRLELGGEHEHVGMSFIVAV